MQSVIICFRTGYRPYSSAGSYPEMGLQCWYHVAAGVLNLRDVRQALYHHAKHAGQQYFATII
jgi:hypothetical protein